MKIASIVGARPNFIKLAPVDKELQRQGLDHIIIHTGQHYNYEMDRVFFDDMGIPSPDYHLGIGSGSHGFQTGEMLKKVEEALIAEKPEAAIVYGDTNTTLAGGLAAAKLHIKCAHIEAGLRSYDKDMPEEINRVLVDHCSDLLLCPTQTAADNLKKEGLTENVYLVGDVMVDAQRDCQRIAAEKSQILKSLKLEDRDYFLATVHRASNTDDKNNLAAIAMALEALGDVVFPCHPRTEKYLKDFGLWKHLTERINVIKPVGYLDMLLLEKNAQKIITDSGGVQKEAYFFAVPCLTLRRETEWIETVETGWNRLVGDDLASIVGLARDFRPTGSLPPLFGDGHAAERIAALLKAER